MESSYQGAGSWFVRNCVVAVILTISQGIGSTNNHAACIYADRLANLLQVPRCIDKRQEDGMVKRLEVMSTCMQEWSMRFAAGSERSDCLSILGMIPVKLSFAYAYA